MVHKSLAAALAVVAVVLARSWPGRTSVHSVDQSPTAAVHVEDAALSLALGPPSARLSVAHTADRAAEIRSMRTLIANEPRVWRIGGLADGEDHAFYAGPVARPGSLAAQIQRQELADVFSSTPETAGLLGSLAAALGPQMASVDAFAGFYRSMDGLMAAPMGSIDVDDDWFGAQRLTLRGFSLRRVHNFDHTVDNGDFGPSLLSDGQVTQVCGPNANGSLSAIREARWLFVIDLADLKQFHVKPDGRKFTPGVVAHFCFNPVSSKLLPLSITLVDSGLTYSRFDSANEWKLAKVALNAAETTQQQLAHFAETHALTIPLRVELYRHLAANHPVRVLLTRHWALDFALEEQAGVLLFNASTPLDKTFGLGGEGCIAFINNLLASGDPAKRALQFSSIDRAVDDGPVDSDARARGIERLPSKYVKYARLHFRAISNFTRGFVDTFYTKDGDVRDDVELAEWVEAAADIQHLHNNFPSSINTKTELSALLARLVFISAVRHHALNGEPTWETLGMPYSAPALWSPLPIRKVAEGGDDVDLMVFLQPREFFGDLVYLSAVFNRPRSSDSSLFGAYNFPQLGDNPQLAENVHVYLSELNSIDTAIVDGERQQEKPYYVLRPGNLPHNNWI